MREVEDGPPELALEELNRERAQQSLGCVYWSHLRVAFLSGYLPTYRLSTYLAAIYLPKTHKVRETTRITPPRSSVSGRAGSVPRVARSASASVTNAGVHAAPKAGTARSRLPVTPGPFS